MSEQVILKADSREIVGKKVKQLRRQGLTPAVIYGQKDPENIQLDSLTAYLTMRDAGDNDIIDLELNGTVRKVLTRDVQKHIVRGNIVHIDFLEVDMDTAISAEASLVLSGEINPEIFSLGIATQLLFSVEIEAKPNDLMSEIEADISVFEKLDDTILVGDLKVPEGVTILSDPEAVVVKFDVLRQEAEEEEEVEEDVEFAAEEDEEFEGIEEGMEDE